MSARRYALILAACLFALFIGVNLLANQWLRGARIDLTENHLYSLSRGTREVLKDLSEPVELKLFYSRSAGARDPATQAYAARVRELLQSYAAAARGRVRFIEVDPQPFSEAEDQAAEAGIEPLQAQGGPGGDPLYFGLVGSNAVDEKRPIPYFSPEREPFLEYEITRLIHELQNPRLPKVALITGLPIEPALAQTPYGAQAGQSMFAMELGRLLNVEKLDPAFTTIPADADVLAILHPYPLSPTQLYAIDQFILAKGRAVIALDPASLVSLQQSYNPQTGPSMTPPSSTLEPLLAKWGVSMPNEVVLDLQGGLPVQIQAPSGQTQTIPQPVFFRVGPEDLDDKDLTTAWLQRGLVFAAAGGFEVRETEGVEATTLARTGGETMRVPAQYAMSRPSPIEILQNWNSAHQREKIAIRLTGALQTAYPNGPPPSEAPPSATDGEAPAAVETPAPSAQAHRARSANTAEIILIADSDLLADDFYVAPQGNGATFADNGAFVLNAIDMLAGSDALVSLRSRAPSIRPMTLLQRLDARAQQRIQARQGELEQELQRTEGQLAQLQNRGEGSGYFSGNLGAELTQQERVEIERFTRRLVEIRRERRDIRRDLQVDVDRLKGWVTFLNVWLAPILIAAAGIYVFWRRQRRAAKRQTPGALASGTNP